MCELVACNHIYILSSISIFSKKKRKESDNNMKDKSNPKNYKPIHIIVYNWLESLVKWMEIFDVYLEDVNCNL